MNPVLLQNDLDVLLNVEHGGSKPNGEFHRLRDNGGRLLEVLVGSLVLLTSPKIKELRKFSLLRSDPP